MLKMWKAIVSLFLTFQLTVFSASHSIENSDLRQNLNNFCDVAKQQCGSSQSHQETHRMVGPPGKKGPRGAPGTAGSIGPQGPPGVVDYERIQSMIDSKLSVIHELEERINTMNETIGNLPAENIQEKRLQPKDCDVSYQRKCFKIPEDLHNSQDVRYNEAERMCHNIGWKLANIYSRAHYESVASYLRTKIPSNSHYATVWIGMTRNQLTGTVYLSNGAIAPTLPWYPGYPSSSSANTKIFMYIKSDKQSTNQGLVNYTLTNRRRGALCEL